MTDALTKAYPAAAREAGLIRRAAAMDVAFDHILYGLHERGVYEAVDVTCLSGALTMVSVGRATPLSARTVRMLSGHAF